MKVDFSSYTGKCECGQEHSLLTREILIEPDATARLAEIASARGLTGGGVVACDGNTRPYAEKAAAALDGALSPELRIAELDPRGLHADERAVAALSALLPTDTRWLVAAGSGTVHDTVRYVAGERGIPFISYPTAASVDGFVSSVSAMTWHGFKKTMPGVAPLAVVADTGVFSGAPWRLTAAGIGDVLGKYVSLADWEIGSLVTGEAICPRISAISQDAVDTVRESLAAIREGDGDGMERLMYALLLSGVAMQLWGDSRPASGAEHHLSHLWEMEAISPHTDALHGEKVGVGLILALREYKRIAAIENLAANESYSGPPLDRLKWSFGGLYGEVAAENDPDILANVNPARLTSLLPRIREIIAGLPEPDAIASEMAKAGCPISPSEIGLDGLDETASLFLSPFVRRRMTFMRLAHLLGTRA